MSMTEEEMAKRFRRALVPYRGNPVANHSERAKIPATNSEAEMALSNAERQARWLGKHREINANNAITVTENNAVTAAETVEILPPNRTRVPWSWDLPVVLIAFGFYGVATWINV